MVIKPVIVTKIFHIKALSASWILPLALSPVKCQLKCNTLVLNLIQHKGMVFNPKSCIEYQANIALKRKIQILGLDPRLDIEYRHWD